MADPPALRRAFAARNRSWRARCPRAAGPPVRPSRCGRAVQRANTGNGRDGPNPATSLCDRTPAAEPPGTGAPCGRAPLQPSPCGGCAAGAAHRARPRARLWASRDAPYAARVVELADTGDSKSPALTGVRVRLPPRAPPPHRGVVDLTNLHTAPPGRASAADNRRGPALVDLTNLHTARRRCSASPRARGQPLRGLESRATSIAREPPPKGATLGRPLSTPGSPDGPCPSRSQGGCHRSPAPHV